jgi:hypothetical protein
LEFLSAYEFDTKNIKGKENKVVNALRKRVHKMHVASISMCMTDLKEIILEVVIVDHHYV